MCPWRLYAMLGRDYDALLGALRSAWGRSARGVFVRCWGEVIMQWSGGIIIEVVMLEVDAQCSRL